MAVPINKGASAFGLLLGFSAFILSILSLFAGANPGFLAPGYMMSVNISQIGKTPLFGAADLSKCKRGVEIDERDIFGDAINGATNGINNIVQQGQNLAECGVEQAKNGLNQAQNAIADKLTQAANLPDFIDLHVMNFCSGKFDPEDYLAKGIKDPAKKITFCSPKALDFSFSLTDTVQKALPLGLTLQDIKWPEEIPKAEATLKLATRVMIYTYIVGVTCAGLVALVSAAGLLVARGIIGLVSMAFAGLSFLSLLLASAIGTIVVRQAVPRINEKGGPIGIAATQGNVWIGLTWASVLIMFVAMIAGVGQMIARKRMMSQYGRDDEYYHDKQGSYPSPPPEEYPREQYYHN